MKKRKMMQLLTVLLALVLIFSSAMPNKPLYAEEVSGEVGEKGDMPVVEETNDVEADEAMTEGTTAYEEEPENPVTDDANGEEAKGEKSEGEQPEGEQPEGEQPEGEQPEGEQPEGEQPEGEQPEGEQPDVEQPGEENPVVENPMIEDPILEDPIVGDPILEEPIVDPIVEEEETVEYPAQTFGPQTLGEITVFASVEEGVFPDGTEMVLSEVSDSAKEQIMEAANEITPENEKVVDIVAVDVTFYYNGEEIQPKDGKIVNVQMHSSREVEGETHQAIHVEDDGEVEFVAEATATEALIEAESFSVLGILALSSADDGFTIPDDVVNSTAYTNYKVAVTVKKLDDEGNYVTGALLQIKDKEGNVIDQWTTEADKHVSLLPNGDYTLHEETTPKGYETAADMAFTVNAEIKDVNAGVVHDDGHDVCWHYLGVPLFYVEIDGVKQEVYCINQGWDEPHDIKYDGTVLDIYNIKDLAPDSDPTLTETQLYNKVVDIIYRRGLANSKFSDLSQKEIRFITEYALKNYTSTMVNGGALFREYLYDPNDSKGYTTDSGNGDAVGQLAKHWWVYHGHTHIPERYVELYYYLTRGEGGDSHPDDMHLYIYSTKSTTEDGEVYQNLLGVTGYSPYNEEYALDIEMVDKIQAYVEGQKIWDDGDNQDGIRPDSVTIKLLANGTEYKTTEAKASEGWKYSFTGLPKKDGGVEIVYTVDEVAVPGYDKFINVYEITNKHTPEVISIDGQKFWDDAENQDGIRPDSVTIKLLADGIEYKTTTATAAGGWKYSFKDVPKKKAGKDIVYTVDETEIPGYTKHIDGFKVTNKHTPEVISIDGLKEWDDANNQDGLRPDSVTIKLLADGVETKTTTATAASGWKYSFKNLPKCKAGKEIVYTVDETAIPGYKTTIDGYRVINKHIPGTVSIEGHKTWKDNDNQDGIRPTSIKVSLLADGSVVNTIVVTKDNGWKYSFANLPKYKSGVEIVYSVIEEKVTGYDTSVNRYDITNTHEPEEISIDVEKVWCDNNDSDDVRPKSVTVRLYANGSEIDSVKLDKSNDWSYTFKNLPKYKNGKLIKYTVKEDSVKKYTTSISGSASNGFVITNTHCPKNKEEKKEEKKTIIVKEETPPPVQPVITNPVVRSIVTTLLSLFLGLVKE